MLAACLALAALFLAFPALDLTASGFFFQDGGWLLAGDSAWLALPYRGLPLANRIVLASLIALWLLSLPRRFPSLHARRATFGFLLLAAVAGPGLLVDNALKDHVGRARPSQVHEFGGPRQFTPAFVPTDQCAKNCSFVSGHVAGTAFLMAFGWLAAPAARRRWLIGSALGAALMGVVRMVPGGHFLSDVIFAWFAVYFTVWLTEWLFRRRGWLPRAPESTADA